MSGAFRSSVIVTIVFASLAVGCAERPGKRKETPAEKKAKADAKENAKTEAAKAAPTRKQ